MRHLLIVLFSLSLVHYTQAQSRDQEQQNQIYKEHIAPYVEDSTKVPDWTAIQQSIASYGANGDEILWRAKSLYYLNKKDYPAFVDGMQHYFGKYSGNISGFSLNNWAWEIFSNCDSKKALTAALAWSRKSNENETGGSLAQGLDTEANILYRLGRKKEAIEVEQKALATAEAAKDASLIAELKAALGKMQKGDPTWPQP